MAAQRPGRRPGRPQGAPRGRAALRLGARRPLAAALALALALIAGPASARVWIERYALEVAMPEAGTTFAAYTLTLVYRAQGERKSEGFKFVGKAPIKDLWATDAEGKRLRASVSREASSGEYKITFEIPPPDASERQTVKIGFLQWAPFEGSGWGYEAIEVPWAPTFRVPITTMEVAFTGPAGLHASSGFRCEGSGPVSCSRTTSSTRPVRLELSSPVSGVWLAVMVAALVLAAGGLLLVVRSRYRELLALRGVIPPASPVAYPGYRAPPPLPVEQEPVLPPDERQSLIRRVAAGAGVLLASIVLAAVLGDGRSEIPMPILPTIVALLGALLTWPFLKAEKGRAWLPSAVLAISIGLALTGSPAGVSFALAPLLVGLFANMPKGAGGSSSGGSSYSSVSSCGGGGGGCGGGGGGGGGGG